MADERPPNPGSDEALEQGCLCPVLDNHHGAGFPWPGAASDTAATDGPQFWITHGCPLHAAQLPYHDHA